MAYDEGFAERVRQMVEKLDGYSERKMFGGLCFMLQGNMCCGVVKEDLMVRLGPEKYEEALQDKQSRPMDFTGRPMKGFVYISIDFLSEDEELLKWLQLGIDYAQSLPRK